MTIMAPVITIDGPSSSGKTTLCKALAESLQWYLLNSGTIYRILSLLIIDQQIAIDNYKALNSLVSNLNVQFKIEKRQLTVIMNGKNISQTISKESIGNIASKIATFSDIRKVLLKFQRSFRIAPGLVADGRDMGTIVFPDALIKIFLNASLEERTKRRMNQLQKNGFNVNFKQVLSDLKQRDDRDRNRKIAPLIPAIDAIIFDSTLLTIDEVIVKVLMYAQQVLRLK